MGSSDGEQQSLSSLWERCNVVRIRFRKSLPWLQFPIPPARDDVADATDAQGDEEAPIKKGMDPHSPTTRALELNWEILNAMLDNYHGEFVDVYYLQREAGP